MTDRSPGDPDVYDDPTRDITLPPLPGRPPSALPRAWAPPQPETAAGPDFSSPPPDLPPEVVEAAADEAPTPEAAPSGGHLADQPTDKLPPPPRPRERTLAFSSPEMRQRPVHPVQVGRAPRRWPWFVLALLPILVIAGAGVTWLLLLRAM
jgi:hypothetical protein